MYNVHHEEPSLTSHDPGLHSDQITTLTESMLNNH